MSYDAFSSVVLVILGFALIGLRRPMSRLQLTALASLEPFKKNPTVHLKRLCAGATIFGVLLILLGVARYMAI
jgi:hypothetical protein